jgi:hypothetical protein
MLVYKFILPGVLQGSDIALAFTAPASLDCTGGDCTNSNLDSWEGTH